MALRKADLAEFFAEFCRFILFFGFYLWLLRNGPVNRPGFRGGLNS